MSSNTTVPTSTRGSVRFRAVLGGDLVSDAGGMLPLTTVNVSAGGLLARTREPVKPWSQVGVTLRLGEETFASQAVCVRVEGVPPTAAAFFFLDPDPRQRLLLVEHLQAHYESYV